MLKRACFTLLTALPLAVLACGSDAVSGSSSPDGGTDGSPGFEAGPGSGDSGTGPHDGGGTSPDGSSTTSDGGVPPPPTTCPQTFTLPDQGYTTVVLQTDYLGVDRRDRR